MTEAFRFFSVRLLTVGGASLVIALALRDARRSIRLAENRMGYLREEQTRLLASLREERRSLQEELEHARERRLEAEREVEQLAERLSREGLLSQQDQGRLTEALDQERTKRLEAEQREQHAHRDAERRIERSERELQTAREAQRDLEAKLDLEIQRNRETQQKLEAQRNLEAQRRREAQRNLEAQREREAQRSREAQRESSPLVAKVLSGGTPVERKLTVEKPLPTVGNRDTARTPAPEIFPETTTPAVAEGQREGKKRPQRAVWMPHPDDGTEGNRASAQHARSDRPTEMFRKHYDKYLENYQGYLELAEGLHQAQDEGEAPASSLTQGEWEERMRRVNDGIQRTAARLDILEGHYPELVTDARISHRASLAKRHLELKRRVRGGGAS